MEKIKGRRSFDEHLLPWSSPSVPMTKRKTLDTVTIELRHVTQQQKKKRTSVANIYDGRVSLNGRDCPLFFIYQSRYNCENITERSRVKALSQLARKIFDNGRLFGVGCPAAHFYLNNWVCRQLFADQTRQKGLFKHGFLVCVYICPTHHPIEKFQRQFKLE